MEFTFVLLCTLLVCSFGLQDVLKHSVEREKLKFNDKLEDKKVTSEDAVEVDDTLLFQLE